MTDRIAGAPAPRRARSAISTVRPRRRSSWSRSSRSSPSTPATRSRRRHPTGRPSSGSGSPHAPAGIVTFLLLTFQVSLGLILSHPTNKSTWKLSKRIFPWHDHIWVFVLAFLLVHIVSIVLDPYAKVAPPAAR